MRRLLVLAVVFVAILAGLWLGGETLLARQLRKAAAQDPGFQIGAVTELRELRRIGVHLTDLRIDRPTGALTLPMAELWLAPSRLTEARLTLPDTATLETAAGPKVLGLSGAGADLRLRPLSGLTLGSMGLHSGAMTLDGAALANGVKVSAELGRLGGNSRNAPSRPMILISTLARWTPICLRRNWTCPAFWRCKPGVGSGWTARPAPGRFSPAPARCRSVSASTMAR